MCLIVKLTMRAKLFILLIMKRVFMAVLLVILCAIILGGCGVRSELEQDADYPRNYPVY